MIPPDAIEQRLTDAYRLQCGHYDEALRIVQQSAQALEQESWAHDLQSALEQVAVAEKHMASDKLAWKHAGRTPGSELRGVLLIIADRIHTLAGAIDRRAQELTARKNRLMPVLDEFIRQRQMLNRYEQVGKAK